MAEQQGEWPKEVDMVLIPLLPKVDGDTGPIGLVPTTVRLWMRTRSKLARQSEASHPNASLFGGAGMGAQRASWAAAFGADTARLNGVTHGHALIDSVKAFEKVPLAHRQGGAQRRVPALCSASFVAGVQATQGGWQRWKMLQAHPSGFGHNRRLWLRSLRAAPSAYRHAQQCPRQVTVQNGSQVYVIRR